MKKTDLAQEIRTALDSTYYYESNAASFTIKIAKTRQSDAHVVENLLTALPALMKHIPRGWENVRSICLKTRDSLALPVYNSLSEMETGLDAVETVAIAEEQPLTEVQKKKMKRQQEQEETKKEVKDFMKDLMKKIKLDI